MKYSELEPVRLIGRVMAAVVAVSAITKQVADTYDEATGWLGLGLAVLVAVGTEVQRSRVTPVAKLQQDNLSQP